MKPVKLVPGCALKREKLSINQIAELIIRFYKKFTLFDTSYSKLNIISEKKGLNQTIEVDADNAELRLAEEILNQNVKEIQKMDRVENPNFDFVMNNSIISIGLEVKIDKNPLMTLHFSFLDSENLTSGIGNIVTNPKCFDTFEKAKTFLDIANDCFNVDYSAIKISDRPLNKVARGYKAPLGYITYFSNDYEIDIPNDLEGIEYEYTDKGKYLILTRDNLTIEDENELTFYSDKLVNLMQTIANKVPEYKK